MGDGERRHSGDWEGDLRSWYNHVEFGQLCGVMRDVAPDERLCNMLHVVLEREKASGLTSCIPIGHFAQVDFQGIVHPNIKIFFLLHVVAFIHVDSSGMSCIVLSISAVEMSAFSKVVRPGGKYL